MPKTSYQSASTEDSHRSDDQKLQENSQPPILAVPNNNTVLGSRGLISRFENTSSNTITTTATNKDALTNLSPTSPTSRTNRSQSQEPSRKSLTLANSLPGSTSSTNTTTTTTTSSTSPFFNGMASSTPFSVKRDSKENTVNNTNSSATDSLTIKRLHEDSKRKVDELTQKVDRLERDLVERDQIIEKLKTSQYIESSLDKREKRAYERKISELEEELKKLESIKADNTRLKEENAALIRVISKLSK